MNARSTMNGKPVLRVPVKTVLNLNSGFKEKLLCDGPALSLGDACAYSCAFCYVPSVYAKLDRVRETLARAGKKHEDAVILRENALEVLKTQLTYPGNVRRFPDPLDRRVVYASPADDVAANFDLANATVEACKLILQFTNWQIRLLSKSTLLPKIAGDLCSWAESNRLRDGWGEEYIRRAMIFGVSTGTLDDDVAAAIEEGTPRVSKRIESLRVLQDNGFRTFAMICPSLPHSDPAEYAQASEEAAEKLRFELCEHVWAEVINLRGESFKRTYRRLVEAGLHSQAYLVDSVSHDSDKWDAYNRDTFLAHAKVCSRFTPGKLRFLTYTTPRSLPFWQRHIAEGAVLL